MFDTATYWLDTIGVDGFRLDAVLYIVEDGGQLQNTAGDARSSGRTSTRTSRR